MNSETENEIQQVELSIEQAKETIEVADAVKRLSANPDFEKVFNEIYFKQEPARLTYLLADPNYAGDNRNDIIKELDSIACARRFLTSILAMGRQAEMAIKADQESLDELRSEA